MNVTIHYCGVWNYLPRASSLAAEIKREFGVDPQIIRGSGGIFDVVVGKAKIFSKHDEGRFPAESEILEKLREMKAK